MTRCGLCRKTAPVFRLDFSPCFLCKECFSKNFEKKILRNLRNSGLLKKATFYAARGGHLEEKTVFYVLGKHLGKSPKLVLADTSSYIAETVESFSSRFLEHFINGRLLRPDKSNLLWLCSAEEVRKYAEIKNISGKLNDSGKVYAFLSETKKKDPSLFFSIARSAEKLNESLARENKKEDSN
ncbi:MAG TPA: hypothetical protein ENN46_00145 [Candidatus Woesearchaeota archaeon]|nr:hypothetical protein [Candidatus Woesearchaeota archaeon]